MELRNVNLSPIGMNQDLSVSKFNKQFSFSNRNIRLTSNEDNTLFTIENERGNLKMNLSIVGTCIGHCVVNDYIVLFTTQSGIDRIYKIDKDFIQTLLFTGSLNFSIDNPISCIGNYEGESNVKVYWVDGKNRPRSINILDNKVYDNNSFDLIKDIPIFDSSNITITKRTYGGSFPSGTAQYFFTYYSINGSESNIVYITDLYYTSFDNRSGSPEEATSTSFYINLTLDPIQLKNYEYVRIYCITTTSFNTTPQSRIVGDFKIESNVSFVDNGTIGRSVNNDSLLSIGGDDIIPYCIQSKDNTLFLGNITLNKPSLEDTLKAYNFYQTFVEFELDDNKIINLEQTGTSSLYSYKPTTISNQNNKITHFKKGEIYRFGWQALHKSGSWSEVIYAIKDWPCDVGYQLIGEELDPNNEVSVKLNRAKFQIDSFTVNALVNSGFIKIRPVMVQPTMSDRRIIAQGFLTNTISHVTDRKTNNCFVNVDYLARPYRIKGGYDPNPFWNRTNWLTDYNIAIEDETFEPITFGHFLSPRMHTIYGEYYYYDIEGEHIKPNYSETSIFSEKQFNYVGIAGNEINNAKYTDLLIEEDAIKDTFLIDDNIVNFWSPDIELNKSFTTSILEGSSFKLIGISEINKTDTYSKLTASDGDIVTTNEYDISNLGSGVIGRKAWYKTTSYKNWQGFDSVAPYEHFYHMWNRTKLNNTPELTIKDKKFSRFLYSYRNFFLNKAVEIPIYKPSFIDRENSSITSLEINKNLCANGIAMYGSKINRIYTDEITTNFGSEAIQYKYNANNHVAFALKEGLYNVKKLNESTGEWESQRTDLDYNEFETLSNTIPFVRNIVANDYAGPILYDKDRYAQSHTGYIKRSIEKEDFEIPIPTSSNSNYLWIGELYRNLDGVQYGGQTKETFGDVSIYKATTSALQTNMWVPCGDSVVLVEQSPCTLYCTSGDTYVQRYDCLRIFPDDVISDNLNNNTEIVSIILESFINVDGRYDRNRYNTNAFYFTPSNYNLINDSYTQKDNFFTGSVIDYNLFKSNKFPTQVIWTGAKTNGEIIDSWSNIKLLSSIDLNGLYGELRDIKLYRNELISFQDKGVAAIQFNSRVQIPTSDGVPIEISNNYKVGGYVYISNQSGAKNKSSITNSTKGLYYIDSYNKSINLYNGESIIDLTKEFGFKSWANRNIENSDVLKISNQLNNFSAYCDKVKGDVYFTNDKYCLCFNETLNTFSSFYDYQNIPYMFNFNNDFVSLKLNNSNTDLYLQNKGKYNELFDELKPTEITYVVNPDLPYYKIFNHVSFTNDSFILTNREDNEYLITEDGAFKITEGGTKKIAEYYDIINPSEFESYIYIPNRGIDYIKVWNEYQIGSTDLKLPKNKNEFKKLSRRWFLNIPRHKDASTKYPNRIRNPWMYLTLGYNPESHENYRLLLHDVVVNYTI